MADDIRATWDDIAHRWNDWGPPLRPSEEDLRITRELLARWHDTQRLDAVRVFLCGVTPEIATMSWPFAVDLTAMDHAESMVRVVWPGDVPGVRRALVGKWQTSGLPPASQDVVVGDGGFGFFDYPAGQRTLARSLRALLKPSGLFLYRHYAQIAVREAVTDALDAARAGRIGNFHIFKWRLAMALQPDSRAGVRLHDIWQAWMDAGLDVQRLPQPGWSSAAVETIHFYRGSDARLYFPTLEEFRGVLDEVGFDGIEVRYPSYELGDRCPLVIARPTSTRFA
jgi:hypothetical protein